MGKRTVTETQAESLAELYVWDCVVSLLEGSTAPRTQTGQRAAERVIAICKKEQQKRLHEYDKNTPPERGEGWAHG